MIKCCKCHLADFNSAIVRCGDDLSRIFLDHAFGKTLTIDHRACNPLIVHEAFYLRFKWLRLTVDINVDAV